MAKKHDPFFVHLWDELTSANILQRPEVQKWMDLPAQLQGQFVEAAKRAMNAALGVPRPKRKAHKKATPKAKAKAKSKAKPKAKTKSKPGPKKPGKARAKTAGVRIVGNG